MVKSGDSSESCGGVESSFGVKSCLMKLAVESVLKSNRFSCDFVLECAVECAKL